MKVGIFALLLVLLSACSSSPTETPVPENIISGEPEAKIYVQPFVFETRDKTACACSYIVQNNLGTDIRKLRGKVKLDTGAMCDFAYMSSEAFADKSLKVSKNVVFGNSCDEVKEIDFQYTDDCALVGGKYCKDEDIVLVDSESISWK